jgi:hypothetical protein
MDGKYAKSFCEITSVPQWSNYLYSGRAQAISKTGSKIRKFHFILGAFH